MDYSSEEIDAVLARAVGEARQAYNAVVGDDDPFGGEKKGGIEMALWFVRLGCLAAHCRGVFRGWSEWDRMRDVFDHLKKGFDHIEQYAYDEAKKKADEIGFADSMTMEEDNR